MMYLLSIFILSISLANGFAQYEETSDQESGAVVWPSADMKLGQVTGLGVDSEGNVHVFHRGSRVWDYELFDDEHKYTKESDGPIKEHTHIIIDQNTGEVISEGGADQYFMPHGMYVDHEDNCWLTDVALHQVFKIPAGSDKPSLVLGERFVPGSDEKHFCQPTDVAVASSGEFFVSDGYCNSRIMKFAPDGTFITSFGKEADTNDLFNPPTGTFNIPHSLTLIEDWNLLCVADRENERIQCFSAGLKDEEHVRPLPTGMFIKEATNLGKVYAVRHKDHYLVGVINTGLKSGKKAVFVVNLENGKSETIDPGLANPHDLAIGKDGSIYIGEIGPNRIVKLTL